MGNLNRKCIKKNFKLVKYNAVRVVVSIEFSSVPREVYRVFWHYFIQVFCTSLNGNTYGTKYRLSGDSYGLIVYSGPFNFTIVKIKRRPTNI